MDQTVVVLSFIFVIDRSICNCNNVAQWSSYFEPAGARHELFSYCYEYCSFPARERAASGYTYDMQTDAPG